MGRQCGSSLQMPQTRMHFRLFFADGGDVYCCCTNSIFTPLGRWLAFQRGPLLFMAMGCNTKQGRKEGLMYLDPTSIGKVEKGSD